MAFTNIPPNPSATNATVQAFDNHYVKPLEIDSSTFNMMKGFFQSKQFDKVAAETISVTIIKQAKLDGYNPMAVLDQLRGLEGIQLNSVVSDILNFNRFKTSMLGHSLGFTPFEPVSRNIVA